MPLYEYACQACGHEFEHLSRSMQDEAVPECPRCKARQTKKKLSLFASAGRGSQGSTTEMGGCGRCGDPHGPCS